MIILTTSAAAQTLSVLQLSVEYASYLNQIGLSGKGSPSEIAKTLKEFSVAELLCNYQEYKYRLKGIGMKKYLFLVSKLNEPGEYSIDMALEYSIIEGLLCNIGGFFGEDIFLQC